MDANRQSEAEASEVRWKEQLTEFYWRFFSRPPSDESGATARLLCRLSWTLIGPQQVGQWFFIPAFSH